MISLGFSIVGDGRSYLLVKGLLYQGLPRRHLDVAKLCMLRVVTKDAKKWSTVGVRSRKEDDIDVSPRLKICLINCLPYVLEEAALA